jgi:hypothetical protein|tara:strand:+ start:202 stop:636 length:435 start_codon:yes stop_codon:yes gene_type:complete
MVKVKVVYMNGKETEYDVEYPKAYIAKIMESENGLMLDQKSVKEIYAADKLIAKFTNGFLNELVLEKSKPKKTAGMGKYKGHTVPAGCDVGQYLIPEVQDIKDKIKADEDWNEYQAEILHAQKMLKENVWVTDHTGGDIEITYS